MLTVLNFRLPWIELANRNFSHSSMKRKSEVGQQPVEGTTPPLNEHVQQEFIRFIKYHPASRLSKNLRTMLLEFLMTEGAMEAEYLQDLLFDLEGLFELLDAVDSH